MRLHNKADSNKVSKILFEFKKIFNFERFLVNVLPKINWNSVYFPVANLAKNVYNSKFSNVHNEINVANVKN